MSDKPNILVVCGRNKKRSRTAEFIFKNDARIRIRSAGLSPSSERKVSEKDLNWANLVFVMEADQRSRIKSVFYRLDLPEIQVLNIPDDYEFMDAELIDLLKGRINDCLLQKYDI